MRKGRRQLLDVPFLAAPTIGGQTITSRRRSASVIDRRLPRSPIDTALDRYRYRTRWPARARTPVDSLSLSGLSLAVCLGVRSPSG